MIEKKTTPPNYGEIVSKFPKVAGRPVIFAWGDLIYNPHGVHIPKALEAHEQLHGMRQKEHADGVTGWWEQYLVDRDFRLMEEIVAHRIEALVMLTDRSSNRHDRRAAMKQVAKKLADPMYDFGLTNQRALKLLRDNPS